MHRTFILIAILSLVIPGNALNRTIIKNEPARDATVPSDYFFLPVPPSCSPPAVLPSTAIGQTSATINWEAPNPSPGEGYDWEVRTSGIGGSGSGGLSAFGSVPAGIVSANVTGLSPGSTYYVYV